MSKTMTPTVWLRLLRRERANWLGRYPSFCAARSMRFFVTAGMYRANGALLSTIDTVVVENPLSFATSRIVTIAAFAPEWRGATFQKPCGDSRPRLITIQFAFGIRVAA